MPSVSTPSYPSISLPVKLLPPPAARTPETVMPQIAAWPHWYEIRRIAFKEYEMDPATFNRLLPEYQRFLGLVMLGHNTLGMFSLEVDQIWPSHVLSSHLWAQFCLEYHGKMINHVPQVPLHDGDKVEICTVCKSCTNCSGGGQGGGGGESASVHSRGTAQAFSDAYFQAFSVYPPRAVWKLDEAEGCASY